MRHLTLVAKNTVLMEWTSKAGMAYNVAVHCEHRAMRQPRRSTCIRFSGFEEEIGGQVLQDLFSHNDESGKGISKQRQVQGHGYLDV